MKLGIRIWILIIALMLSLLAIRPTFETGVLVTSIEPGSESFRQGLRQGEVLQEINGVQIQSLGDYSSAIDQLVFLDGEDQRVSIITDQGTYIFLTNESLKFGVGEIPRTRIQTGLDLRGGSRALVKPDVQISESELQDLVDIARNRFNIYGLSDVSIQGVSDLSGERFMLVEVAGASPADLEQLVGQQGKFEAKIGNETVFVGGDKDISDVCRNDATCAGITQCFPVQGGTACNFAFTIYLRQEAAQRHADITSEIPLDPTGQYLEQDLTLIVDDQEVDVLRIGSSLKGQVTTQISIQGSGTGANQDEAIRNARENMNSLQTVLLTGSLPYKLEIVKLDTISPSLGKEFISTIFLAVLSAIAVVSLIVFIRYRNIKAAGALLLTSFSELFIILGVAALIKWNLDLPSIAGILATIGTGVDQQIIIMDEAGRSKNLGIKERLKRASGIILSAYLTVVAAMLPLYWAGAGLFKGFAITTIVGVTAGVLITRPAFAEMIKRIEK